MATAEPRSRPPSSARTSSCAASTPTTTSATASTTPRTTCTRRRRASTARSSRRSPSSSPSRSGCASSASRRSTTSSPARSRPGARRCSPRSTTTTSTTSCAPPSAPSAPGTTSPRTSRRPSTGSGIPEAERKFLSGVGAQYESEVVYHQVNEELEKQGVIFMDMDSALREHEDLVREYFATIIPPNDNKLAALNSAVWSGGSFVYVPPGVHVEMPLQAYFRINTESMGQFERTLIIADEGSYVHYVEGCTAPTYSARLAALGGGRADRQAGRPDPLHDGPELVDQRVQPRDQARGRRDATRRSSGSTATSAPS